MIASVNPVSASWHLAATQSISVNGKASRQAPKQHAFYTAACLQHAVQTYQNTETGTVALLQAKYHGIALTVNPDKLTPVNGKPLEQAIETVLRDPIFKVRRLKQMTTYGAGIVLLAVSAYAQQPHFTTQHDKRCSAHACVQSAAEQYVCAHLECS